MESLSSLVSEKCHTTYEGCKPQRCNAMIRIVASLNLPVNSNGLMAPWSGKSFIIGSKFFEEVSITISLIWTPIPFILLSSVAGPSLAFIDFDFVWNQSFTRNSPTGANCRHQLQLVVFETSARKHNISTQNNKKKNQIWLRQSFSHHDHWRYFSRSIDPIQKHEIKSHSTGTRRGKSPLPYPFQPKVFLSHKYVTSGLGREKILSKIRSARNCASRCFPKILRWEFWSSLRSYGRSWLFRTGCAWLLACLWSSVFVALRVCGCMRVRWP